LQPSGHVIPSLHNADELVAHFCKMPPYLFGS
jgi:hypothetical protein